VPGAAAKGRPDGCSSCGGLVVLAWEGSWVHVAIMFIIIIVI
jgi:hypothetical protein